MATVFPVQKEVNILGHHLSPAGVALLQEKVSAISQFPPPTSVKTLQKFVSMVNYNHCFLPNVASIMTALYTVLAGKPKEQTW